MSKDELQPQTGTPIPDNVVEVKKPVLEEGEIKFMSKAAFKGRTPESVKRIIKSVQWTLMTLIGAVSGTTLFDGNQAKFITFCLVVGAIIAEGIGKSFGVETAEQARNK